MTRKRSLLEFGQAFFVGRMAHDSDFHTHRAKGGDWLHLTPTHALTQDCDKAIWFLTERTAKIYHSRLPWKLREQLGVYVAGARQRD